MRPIALIGLLSIIGAGASAQVRGPAKNGAAALNCRACHTAVTPTKKNPALVACPRLLVKGYHAVDEAPPTITLGRATGNYGPVKFSHREHAHMAETGAGCAGCHHYDQARAIQKCSACHSEARQRTDLGKPDLKAAVHRQCLECHLEWNGATKCGSCHQQAGAKVTGVTAPATATVARAKAPTRVVYETGSAERGAVTFLHAEHTGRFALDCASCHAQESCRTCHGGKSAGANADVLTRQTAKGISEDEAHARCATCHANASCATCHTGKVSRTAAFDHKVRTGWALNRFHAPLACRECHTAPPPFRKLASDCESCHKGWQAKFEHRRTGFELDELHVSVECSGCHEDKTFTAPPACAGCHSDKKWPADKPGKAVAKPAPRR